MRDFSPRDSVQLVWRSFELDPSAPREAPEDLPYVRRLARKYGRSEPQAQAMIDNMRDVAANESLQMDFSRIRTSNTFDAHRLLHFAHEHGRQDQLKEELFRAYFSAGQVIAAPAALVEAAQSAGLDADQAMGVVTSDAYAAAVRADESAAGQIGITGVPFYAIGRYGVAGAQPASTLLNVLQKAWEEVPDVQDPGPVADGAASCGPDGCELG